MARYIITNQPEPIDFELAGDVKRTIQNAKNLLMCRMGEVPYDRLRGFNPELMQLPMKEFGDRLMEEIDRVLLWEPDAEAVDASFTADENGEYIITVTIDVADQE